MANKAIVQHFYDNAELKNDACQNNLSDDIAFAG